MAYEPKNDEALRCACRIASDGDEYESGWDNYFTEVLVPSQLELIRSEDFCPRTSIRHAAARLAVAIATVSHSRNEAKSQQGVDRILPEIPKMLAEMVDDALVALKSESERDRRGAAAGFKRVTH